MSIQALTGEDVIKLTKKVIDDSGNAAFTSTVLNDFADGDIGTIEFPNDISGVKTGKGGNSVFAFNATGLNAKMSIRIIRGSTDDKYIQTRLAEWIKDASLFTLITGELTKKVGDGSGKLTSDKYTLSGGTFQKLPEVKSNVEGDTDQAVVVYNLTFAKVVRTIT